MSSILEQLKKKWDQDPVYQKIAAAHAESIRHSYNEVTGILLDAMIACRRIIDGRAVPLICGVLIGSVFTTALVGAGNFYNSHGQPAAPSGSIQQFDYFRERQQQLDVGAMRRQQEEYLRQQRVAPCGR